MNEINHILDFLLRHWVASAMFVALLVTYIIFELRQEIIGRKKISVEETVAWFNHQHAVLIDIRPAEDFKHSHILGSVNINPNSISKNISKYSQKPVVVICANGKESYKFAIELEGQRFVQVASLNGGMRAWQDAGMPVTSKA